LATCLKGGAAVRIAVAGAGLAGLAAAAGFIRLGHDVTVFEQADSLRASGLAFNLAPNATSLLPSLGVPADRLPGEPYSRIVLRAGGREVATVRLPPWGTPHVTVERADVLTALADTLPPGTIEFGRRCTDPRALAASHDLLVVADGTHSVLREAVTGQPRRRWGWTVWQASTTADVSLLPPDAGVCVVRPGFFSGIFRLPGGGRITWFAEQPGRAPGTGSEFLAELAADPDPLLRSAARATTPKQWTQWSAADMWPPTELHRGNIVLVGDAAHAMLPTIGQGACQSLEDGVALAAALATAGSLGQALRQYEHARIRRVRLMTSLARTAALARRPGAPRRMLSAAASARLLALTGGPVMRWVARPVLNGQPRGLHSR
jgi:2-polyprenyl-6-methoxyphenol hydroxylase-like FAD-dependent oxidoreductase